MKRSIFIGILTTVVIVIIFLIVSPRRAATDLNGIIERGRLSVLIESGEHGLSRDSQLVQGFQYEIIKRFADTLGLELVLINQQEVKNGIDELNKGNCDVLVSLKPIINDTTSTVMYLRPIVSTRLMLVQKKDSTGVATVRYQYPLDGESIAVMMNSAYIPRLEQLSQELAIDLKIDEQKIASLDKMVSGVATGNLSFAVCPEYLAEKLMKRYPGVDISLPLSFQEQLSWSVDRRSVQLYERLNAFLEQLIVSPDYGKLYQKYFSADTMSF